MTFAPADLILHRARKVDVDGAVEDAWIAVADGRILAIGSGDEWQRHNGERTEAIDVDGGLVTPGLIDLHMHGGGGATVDDGPDAAQTAIAAHRAHGTTRTLLSFVSAPLTDLVDRLRWAAQLTAEDSTVLGVHLEGPFLSDERRGVHDAAALRDPDPETVATLIEAGGGALRQITIAPERAGALQAIAAFSLAGVVPALGHTTANFDLAERAFAAGARLLTHAFNAMPGLCHRSPGPVAAAFEQPGVVLEIILDGIHVDPRIASLAFTQAPGRVALVTDAMAGAAAGDGEYWLGTHPVTVTSGTAIQTATGALAGSTLTLDRAVRRAVLELQCAPLDAVVAATMTPARVLGLNRAGGALRLGALRPGYTADIVHFDNEWAVRDVWVAGVRERRCPVQSGEREQQHGNSYLRPSLTAVPRY